mmetsp:Transcript_1346/g.1806  ORF Transcript_1346/g.1806 Transcript_1346/m.1806 type:complete len:350 (-) Transcript_1346:437-1486(-)|eukprot:CAMPEP_0117749086 /NCGR_PEP_ID=MMETSP0947-20121206/9531_1 /TAXON_ID=44440 /ORGANISM="Chattonella subsalsa, Strain CCMP2191" /LENGTH=349 /DNA_ID=CAMNT_0005566931 /DNA_START=114 /DNA_END=1163 /DNA_ORIENTATION=-
MESSLGSKKFYGYQGFKSWAHQDLPNNPPGETNATRNSKFAQTGHGVVYNRPIDSELALASSKPVSFESTALVRPNDYKVPDRRGVSVNFSNQHPYERSKPFLGASTYKSNFRDFATEILNIHDFTVEEYRDAFSRIDRDNNGYINLKEMRTLLTTVQGPQCPDWVVEKYMKFFDSNSDGRVTWEEFSDNLDSLKELILEDTRLKEKKEPEWLTASKKVYPVVHKEGMKSTYQVDVGSKGEDPRDREFLRETGMATTTGDLLKGTSSDTHHIPGYGGHIPAKKFGRAGDHGEGKDLRHKTANLRLFHSHNLPGYTGHQPVNPNNDKGERQTGAHRATTSGAAALGIQLL